MYVFMCSIILCIEFDGVMCAEAAGAAEGRGSEDGQGSAPQEDGGVHRHQETCTLDQRQARTAITVSPLHSVFEWNLVCSCHLRDCV